MAVFKYIIESLIKEVYIFDNKHLDSHHGQSNYKLNIKDENSVLAFVEYSIFEDKVHIDVIESLVTQKGYAKELIRYLAKKFGYENIQWGTVFGFGANLKKSMDVEFNFNEDEHLKSKTKHFNLSDFDFTKKIPILYKFIHALYSNGREAWNQYITDIRNDKNGIDFNEVYDISQFIKGSKTNDNPTNIDPPDWIIDDFNTLREKISNL